MVSPARKQISMRDDTQGLIERIHDTPTRMVFASSGGGGGAIAQLLEVPGASRTILEAVVPYAEPALVAWLGSRPEQFCSVRTARAMAMVAFRRAWQYEASAQVAGVGCTASLTTDRPKLGPHRAHLALQTAGLTAFWSIELQKGQRTRAEEESLVNRILLNVVAEACGLGERLPLDLMPGEEVLGTCTSGRESWRALLLGETEVVQEGRPLPRGRDSSRAIFPGEFNPLHVGHCRMAEIAADVLGIPVEFETSITNVDKPPLDYWEIDRRLRQFDPQNPVLLTRAARFFEKSRLFPGATFVVGIDTLRRIGDPRYYGNDMAACRSAIELIASRGCRFLVFGRNLGTGFMSLGDLDVPDPLRALCREIPADRFREDISSTALRRAGKW
jgi:nicotinamide mononucleotide (NMN) deamidase PncC